MDAINTGDNPWQPKINEVIAFIDALKAEPWFQAYAATNRPNFLPENCSAFERNQAAKDYQAILASDIFVKEDKITVTQVGNKLLYGKSLSSAPGLSEDEITDIFSSDGFLSTKVGGSIDIKFLPYLHEETDIKHVLAFGSKALLETNIIVTNVGHLHFMYDINGNFGTMDFPSWKRDRVADPAKHLRQYILENLPNLPQKAFLDFVQRYDDRLPHSEPVVATIALKQREPV